MKKFIPTTPSHCMLRVFQDRVFACCCFHGIPPVWVSIPLLLVVSCWTEAQKLRYTCKIANCVSSLLSPVPSLATGVVSHDQCYGNQRCPSFDGRLRRPFSCPNAENNFDGCAKNFKHDLHNASFWDLSNIGAEDLFTLTCPRKLRLQRRSELITDIQQITLHFLFRFEFIIGCCGWIGYFRLEVNLWV